MSEYNNSYKWGQAAVKGLLLALVTIACSTVAYLFPDKTFINLVMSLVKLVGSIWLLVYFMKEYAKATGQQPFSFGVATVLFSSLICAFFDAASYAWLFPSLAETANEAMSQALSTLPSEAQSIAERMMDNYPRIAFISGFIKDFIIGLIVAAIANSSMRPKDPFAADKQEDELA